MCCSLRFTLGEAQQITVITVFQSVSSLNWYISAVCDALTLKNMSRSGAVDLLPPAEGQRTCVPLEMWATNSTAVPLDPKTSTALLLSSTNHSLGFWPGFFIWSNPWEMYWEWTPPSLITLKECSGSEQNSRNIFQCMAAQWHYLSVSCGVT